MHAPHVVVVDGPAHPHAFTGLPVLARPEFASRPCASCDGRGAMNDLWYPESQRCRIRACGDCDGFGWRTSDGHRVTLEIDRIDGAPRWTLRHLPAPAPVALLRAVDGAPGPSASDDLPDVGAALVLAA